MDEPQAPVTTSVSPAPRPSTSSPTPSPSEKATPPPRPAETVTETQTQTEAPEPTQRPESSAAQNVYYENCDEARAAGAAPLLQGEPGYRPELDRDGDGIACDPYIP
ncbi:excalibur calcium-binding domain-containing protein [Streptomyces sp. NPDC054855]